MCWGLWAVERRGLKLGIASSQLRGCYSTEHKERVPNNRQVRSSQVKIPLPWGSGSPTACRRVRKSHSQLATHSMDGRYLGHIRLLVSPVRYRYSRNRSIHRMASMHTGIEIWSREPPRCVCGWFDIGYNLTVAIIFSLANTFGECSVPGVTYH